jgi:hypothetical protein
MLRLFNQHFGRLLLLAAFAAVALGAVTVISVGPVPIAQARNTCLVKEEGGTTWWVSCGSSAGNFVYRCDAGGCTDCDTSFCNAQADQFCGSCDPLGD